MKNKKYIYSLVCVCIVLVIFLLCIPHKNTKKSKHSDVSTDASNDAEDVDNDHEDFKSHVLKYKKRISDQEMETLCLGRNVVEEEKMFH